MWYSYIIAFYSSSHSNGLECAPLALPSPICVPNSMFLLLFIPLGRVPLLCEEPAVRNVEFSICITFYIGCSYTFLCFIFSKDYRFYIFSF